MTKGRNLGNRAILLKVALVLCLVLAGTLAGCSGPASHVTGTPTTATVSLLMTDTPPANVGLLSFEVTLTSAVLNPGNVQLLAAPVTVEVTRLQTETALIAANANIPVGTYTSVTLTYSTPQATFLNATGVTVSGCPNGQICTASPTTVTTTGAVTLVSSLAAMANTQSALLLDLNLSTALSNTSNTLSVDLIGGSTVTAVTPVISGGSFASLEGVVGVVTVVNSTTKTFSLQTPLGTFVVSTAATVPATVYANFPSSVSCTSPGFSCVAVGQILSVNMGFESVTTNGAFIAAEVFFEDANFSVPEIEGVVVATTGVTPPGQFRIVVLGETSGVSGIPIGTLIDVEPSLSPAATFDIDNLGADTSAFTFAALGDMIVGQEVSLQELPASTGSLIVAGRVQLESSRITARLSSTALPNFDINNLPAYFGALSQIQVNTGAFTEFGGSAVSDTQLIVGHQLSVRGQLFARGLTPVAVATKVIQH